MSLAPQTRDPIYSSFSGKAVASVIDTLGPSVRAEAEEVLAPFVEESKQAAWTAEKVAPFLPTAAEIDAEVKRTQNANAGTSERR